MSTAHQLEHVWTPEEYLAMERKSETKHELIDGQIYAMAGASLSHIRIVSNLTRHLGNCLVGKPCEPCPTDLKVRIPGTKNYVYPDVTVICGEPQLEDEHKDILLNPTVIFEVLSPSTAEYDRKTKFHFYRRIPSLRHYVMVTQDEMRVEHYVRSTNGKWVLTDLGKEDQLGFDDLEVSIAVADIYERVQFESR